jgi:hypothetical protein
MKHFFVFSRQIPVGKLFFVEEENLPFFCYLFSLSSLSLSLWAQLEEKRIFLGLKKRTEERKCKLAERKTFFFSIGRKTFFLVRRREKTFYLRQEEMLESDIFFKIIIQQQQLQQQQPCSAELKHLIIST